MEGEAEAVWLCTCLAPQGAGSVVGGGGEIDSAAFKAGVEKLLKSFRGLWSAQPPSQYLGTLPLRSGRHDGLVALSNRGGIVAAA